MASEKIRSLKLIKRENIVSKFKTERILVFFVLFFSLLMEVFINYLALPSVIRFFNDLCIVLIAIFSFGRISSTFKRLKIMPVIYCIMFYLLLGIFSAIINFVELRLYIWAFRNTFRGILYLIFCVVYLDSIDLKNVFNVLYYLSWLHLALCLIQYFALGLKQDDVGGIFGGLGSMEPVTFMVILLAYYLVAYLEDKEKLRRLIFIIFSSMVVSALAEERFAYIMFVLIFIGAFLLTKPSLKKPIIAFIAIIALAIGLYLMKLIFPDVFKVLTDFDKIFEYASATYEEGYKIPRLGAIGFINETFFQGDLLKLFFGYGFGATETSELAIFQSEFYQIYGEYNYRWFTHQWVFLEGGIVGLVSYISIFVAVFFCVISRIKERNGYTKTLISTGVIMALYSIVLVFYNATLKNDMSYIAFFGLAIGLIGCKPPCYVKKSLGENNFNKEI